LWGEDVEQRVRALLPADSQIAELPEKVQFCSRCVVSNQRPRIVFEDGVCSACRYKASQAAVDWKTRDAELCELLDSYRRDSGWDVIVPTSGGKDSGPIAHRLKHEYRMHPLAVKWAPFGYTDIGFQNFNAFVHSGFDCLVGWPNGFVLRKLSRIALEVLGDAWQPFAYGQLNFAMHMALRMGIPLVFFGENGEAEYGGDPSANDKPCWGYDDWERVYLKGAGIDRLFDIGLEVGAFTRDERREISEFYRLPPRDKLGGVQFHWFAYYRKWHPQGNYYYATENTGFTANTERSEGTYSKYASLDDRFDGFHYYMAYVKFGIGRCTSDAAHEIRDGEITRDEGVALVNRFDGEFPKRHFQEFLSYLNLDKEHFRQVCDRWRRPEIWDRDDRDEWVPRHKVS